MHVHPSSVDVDSVRPGQLLAARLSIGDALPPDAEAAVRSLPYTLRSCRRDERIAEAGVAPQQLQMLLDGAAACYRTTPSGRRAVAGLLLPGDVFDWPRLALKVRGDGAGATPRHSIRALTKSVVVTFRLDPLLDAIERDPRLALALDSAALAQQEIMLEWVASLVSRQAAQRLAHLLLEYFYRLKAVGLADGASCDLALTQAHLSACRGLSLVHTNRVLQQLRAEELVQIEGHQLTFLDQRRLEAFADFDPRYLGCEPEFSPLNPQPLQAARRPRCQTSPPGEIPPQRLARRWLRKS